MSRRRSLLAAPLAVLALAAPASAAEQTFGSDLEATPTIAYSDGNDWSSWNTSLASGGLVRSPVTGEVNVVRLKGGMILEGREQQPPAPGLVAHVLVLRPQDDGRVAIAGYTGISHDLPLPIYSEDDPNRVTTWTRSQLTRPEGHPDGPSRLCIQEGDYLGFTTSGGFGGFYDENPEQIYVNGARFQVFAPVRQSTSLVHNQGGAYDFKPFQGTRAAGRELLMNATVGTREDARWTCRTAAEKKENLDAPTPKVTGTDPGPGTAGPASAYAGATIPVPARTPKVRGRKVNITLSCPGPNGCGGALSLRGYTTRAKKFLIAAGQTATFTVRLNRAARRKLPRRGAGLTVKAIVAHPNGTHTTRRFVIRRA